MEELSMVAQQGPWAALCVFLLVKIFKKDETRKKEYTELIKENQETICKSQDINALALKVIEQNQEIIKTLSNKYDSIKDSVDTLNVDVREIFRTLCKTKEGPND